MTSNRDSGVGEPVGRLPLEGLRASWTSLTNADREDLTIGFENEAWTVQGIVSGADIHYVLRMSALWRMQQMLLFRDLDEPDLWLANDGTGRWGEINGSRRRELGGCEDVDISCSAFTRTLAVRRLSLDIGQVRDVHSVVVDHESLAVTRARITYARIASTRWMISRDDCGDSHEFDVDEFGLPIDIPGHFTRTN